MYTVISRLVTHIRKTIFRMRLKGVMPKITRLCETLEEVVRSIPSHNSLEVGKAFMIVTASHDNEFLTQLHSLCSQCHELAQRDLSMAILHRELHDVSWMLERVATSKAVDLYNPDAITLPLLQSVRKIRALEQHAKQRAA